MSRICSFFLISLLALFSCSRAIEPEKNPYLPSLQSNYDEYRENSITNRRFKHRDIVPLVQARNAPLTSRIVGQSTEGRPITLVTFGEGPIEVLLWSQMHGDEPTATMALIDIMNFLEKNDDLNPLRELLSEKLRIHMLPMLNPDGAERFQRRNVQGIDINRDALSLQTKEGRLLKNIRDSLQAAWGFNLHDQERSRSVGDQPASISFLAPAFDYEKTISPNRRAAMQVIAAMNDAIQPLLPNAVGRYWDDFEPRAFGDNFQKWGTKTILIESGGRAGDREKQYIRKANFIGIMSALYAIATDTYSIWLSALYDSIPVNSRNYHDVIVRNLTWSTDTLSYVFDVAYRFSEVENDAHDRYYLKAAISDLGDLSFTSAYKEFDAKGYTVVPGKVYDQVVEDWDALLALPAEELLKNGITDIRLLKVDSDRRFGKGSLFKIVSQGGSSSAGLPQVNDNPSMLLKKGEEIDFAIVNGIIIDLKKPLSQWGEEWEKY